MDRAPSSQLTGLWLPLLLFLLLPLLLLQLHCLTAPPAAPPAAPPVAPTAGSPASALAASPADPPWLLDFFCLKIEKQRYHWKRLFKAWLHVLEWYLHHRYFTH